MTSGSVPISVSPVKDKVVLKLLKKNHTIVIMMLKSHPICFNKFLANFLKIRQHSKRPLKRMVKANCVDCNKRQQNNECFYNVSNNNSTEDETIKIDSNRVLCFLCWSLRTKHYKV